jgi:predicted RecA/RadA family phage recombinase
MTVQYGEELVTNGGFDSNIAWTEQGDLAIAGGCVMASGFGPGMGLSQDINIISGRTYRVEYTIQSYIDGGVIVKLGSAAGQPRSSDGSYVETITAAGDSAISFDFSSGSSFVEVELDAVSVREVIVIPATVAFIQDGKSIDYTPTVDVTAGRVIVLGDLICVANLDLPAHRLGALAVEGVFDFAKATGGSTAIAVGTKVYWDVADQQAKADDEAGANKYLGKTIAAAGDNNATVRIRLEQ